jgi:hypothetical protein
MPPGIYTLSASAAGYLTLTRQHIEVEADGGVTMPPFMLTPLTPGALRGIPPFEEIRRAIVNPSLESGTVGGEIGDAQGVVPGATVVLLSEIDDSRKIGPVLTDGRGIYTFPVVPPDIYTLSISMKGFKDVTRTGIEVRAGERVIWGTRLLPASTDVGVIASAEILRSR